MKFIKLYESFEDIDTVCRKYGIKNYTINSDGIVDVNGSVNLSGKDLTKLPLIFGNITGNFDCSYNNILTLEGCPQSVGRNFDCRGNQLTTLECCPQLVGGYFHCGNNSLTTLEGSPQSVGSDFHSSANQLITLKGCPKLIGGNFNCSLNKLTTLEGPQSIVGYFECSYNSLTTLEGCPKSVGGVIYLMDNELKDLYGFPEFFDHEVYYRNNPVEEILILFKTLNLGKAIEFLNEYSVIQQDGKVVMLDRLEEVFYTLNMEIPKINLKNYEVY